MLTHFALPFTTLTGSVEVAAEMIGLESFELDICLPWWRAKMAQCLLRMYMQETESVHVWTSKLVCLCVSSLSYVTCKCDMVTVDSNHGHRLY